MKVNHIFVKDAEQATQVQGVGLISVIPQKYIEMTDEMLKEIIRNKIEAKNLKVKQVNIHRTVGGAFIRSDVSIEPVAETMIKKLEFPFDNCQMITCFGFR